MKKVSTRLQSALTSQGFGYFIIIKFWELGYRCTTLPYDVTINNEVYAAANRIKLLESPTQSSIVDREAYKIQITDLDNYFRQYFESEATGDRVTVSMGVGDIETGLPYTNADDFLILFSGIIDTCTIESDPQEGTLDAIVELSSPVASLDKRNTFYSSKRAYLDRIANPENDTSFDYVHQGSGQSLLKWGKA